MALRYVLFVFNALNWQCRGVFNYYLLGQLGTQGDYPIPFQLSAVNAAFYLYPHLYTEV